MKNSQFLILMTLLLSFVSIICFVWQLKNRLLKENKSLLEKNKALSSESQHLKLLNTNLKNQVNYLTNQLNLGGLKR